MGINNINYIVANVMVHTCSCWKSVASLYSSFSENVLWEQYEKKLEGFYLSMTIDILIKYI